MSDEPLSAAQIEEFVNRGYTVLSHAFSPDVVRAVTDRIWSRMGLSPDADPASWPAPLIYIKETLGGPPYQDAYTDRVGCAYDQLLGVGRWTHGGWLGFWPTLFPGFAQGPWAPPTGGWHIDGGHFQRRLWSPERTLLTLFLFSDIGPGDGGTAVSVGSHRLVARVLAESEPFGMSHRALVDAVNTVPRADIAEITGRSGDVVLLHPYLLHAQSPNTGTQVRIMANPYVSARSTANPRWGSAESPVERAIRHGGESRTPVAGEPVPAAARRGLVRSG